LIEAVVLLPRSALQLLSPADKANGKLSLRKRKRRSDERKRGGKKLRDPTEIAYLEHPPHGTRVNPQRLVQRVVERGAEICGTLSTAPALDAPRRHLERRGRRAMTRPRRRASGAVASRSHPRA
jgi:hypothetical protein